MADENEEETKTEGEEEAPPKKKKGVLLGGGIVGLIGMAYVASLMAVPGKTEAPPILGPFVAPLAVEQLSVNLSGAGNKNYLALTLKAEYVGYDETYAVTRIADPLVLAMLDDTTIIVCSQKEKEDVNGAVGKEVLREELRVAIDPLLFPVHVGETAAPHDADAESGLAPGMSMDQATMRGYLHDHVLKVDAIKGTIQLDAGDPVSFDGTERDLAVTGPTGDQVYVDVTGLVEGFVGEVPVGVMGSIKKIHFAKFLVQ